MKTRGAASNRPNSCCDSLAAHRCATHGSSRPVVVGLAFFLAGVVVSALIFHHRSASPNAQPIETAAKHSTAPDNAPLTPSTVSVLQNLGAPVEIHFYSLLDPASVPESMKAFASRAAHLLSRYEQQASGKIKVVSADGISDANAKAADADGISAFNRDKGDACFLGLAVLCHGQKAALAQLSPDFEPALESDITRAIQQVCQAPPVGKVQNANIAPSPEILAAVKKVIPNPDKVTLEQGTSLLRQSHLDELSETVLDIDTKLKAAEAAFRQAETNQSEAAQQAARAELQRLEVEKSEKLKALFAKSQAEVQAFQQLKSSKP